MVIVGIIGGGQLSLMLVEAAKRLGIDVRVLASSKDDPVCEVLPDRKITIGDLQKYDDIYSFGKTCNSIVLDNEHVEISALLDLVKGSDLKVYPQASLMQKNKDRLYQKKMLVEKKIRCTPSADFEHFSPNRAFFPLVAKRRTMSYDGRGIEFINTEVEYEEWLMKNKNPSEEFILEDNVTPEAELSVTAFRTSSGEVRIYPCVQFFQVNSICGSVIFPPLVSQSTCCAAQALTGELMSSLGVVGLLTVELFYSKGEVMVNEVSLRTHNTAHYTIEACTTSQFEHTIRIAAQLPTSSTDPIVNSAIMANIIGNDCRDKDVFEEKVRLAILGIPNASLHLYSKQPKPGRKLGHLVITGNNLGQVSKCLEECAKSLKDICEPLVCLPGRESDFGRYEVAVVMGSESDLPIMRHAVEKLKTFGISHFVTIVSAHRTPKRMYEFAAKLDKSGFKVVIAGAGGAAHLPGMIASMTHLPVIGVPVSGKNLGGLDSLLSIVQMPPGIPVATVSIDNAENAAILAARILSMCNEKLVLKLHGHERELHKRVSEQIVRTERENFQSINTCMNAQEVRE